MERIVFKAYIDYIDLIHRWLYYIDLYNTLYI